MVQTPNQVLTLETFLQLPETKPAQQFIHYRMVQKPVPQGEHSILQGQFCKVIDAATEPQRIAKAFPELRCVFGGAAIIPDVSVFRWERIPRSPSGKVANRFETCPDWAIEILSPDQSQTQVLANLLHCIEHGTTLGWLLDPSQETVLVILSEARIKLYQGSELLPILAGIDLKLTPDEIFGWLLL
jgi:Uma2 family endonuclease